MTSLAAAFAISNHGLMAQTKRMKVIAENIANSQTTPQRSGESAYRRKYVSFDEKRDAGSGASLVAAREETTDSSVKKMQYMPDHPAANEHGMVELPNVDVYIEMADMREASRSFQANVQVYKSARDIFEMQVDLLRSAK